MIKHKEGNICCEGCYRLGIDKGKEDERKRIIKIAKEYLEPDYLDSDSVVIQEVMEEFIIKINRKNIVKKGDGRIKNGFM